MQTLKHFFAMGGYAMYVWPAYASTFVLLFAQWFLPWKRWRQLIQNKAKSSYE